MRKTFTTIALFAVLGTLAVSCQKENIIDDTNIVAENDTVYTVSYTVDGVTHQITPHCRRETIYQQVWTASLKHRC